MSDNIHDAFSPLYFILKIVGLSSVQYKNGKFKPIGRLRRAYSWFLAVLVLIAFVWSTHGKFIHTRHPNFRVYNYIHIICSVLLSAIVVVDLLLTSTLKLSNQTNVLDYFESMDRRLEIDYARIYSNSKKVIQIQILIANMLVMSIFFYQIYLLGTNDDFRSVVYYLPECLLNYMMTMSLFQMINFLALIRNRFKHINALLLDDGSGKRLDATVVSTVKKKSLGEPRNKILPTLSSKCIVVGPQVTLIHNVCRVHDTLCDAAETVNNSYELVFLLLTFVIIATIIRTIYNSIVYFSDKSFNSGDIITITLVSVLWSVFYFALAVGVTVYCHLTSVEAHRSGIVARKILMDRSLPQHVQQDLKMLSRQVSQRRLAFSACGFFTIDMSVIYIIVGAVTSYLIVLLQFEDISSSKK